MAKGAVPNYDPAVAPPCDRCPLAQACHANQLACLALMDYVTYGTNDTPPCVPIREVWTALQDDGSPKLATIAWHATRRFQRRATQARLVRIAKQHTQRKHHARHKKLTPTP